ncbi:MAG TPA: SRPBCC domain-containing protein [Pseudonocardiaceae bacterium]|nr:SRPBCC domain-containing protein [Pseudonocardiaceae bacterium]
MNGNRIMGTPRTVDGKGVVRMEDRFDTDIDDLWSAFTDPARLARWLGEFDGDLRRGGQFRARFFASGWEGTGRVEVCEPPRHLLVMTQHVRQTEEHVVEATLTADGDGTILVLEQRGMPMDLLPAYGAGIQVHIEDLAAHIAGREHCDAEARWKELEPEYAALATRNRILGTLHTADGSGIVRMRDRYDTDIDDLWSALTTPDRLARWLGEFDGDLRLGGEYRFRFFASGSEGMGRVEVCEPPRRLLLAHGIGRPDEKVIEVTLTADGDQTVLLVEERGMPVELLAAYGAGIQVHIEDLAAHIAGRERCDSDTRWDELQPAYDALAAEVG